MDAEGVEVAVVVGGVGVVVGVHCFLVLSFTRDSSCLLVVNLP